MEDHKEFLKRIEKTLYYGQLPSFPCLSLPVTELSCDLWSEAHRGRTLRRLHCDAASTISRSGCVSPCTLVLAVLYLERLNTCNPQYVAATDPMDLFLVLLMVGNKFLQDGGEDDEVICSEWAASGDLEVKHLKKLEAEFLMAIDWNVYVSEELFEKKLVWLERHVALRQAQLRGFFTYTDLAATSDHALVREILSAVAAASFACLASLLALLASTILISHIWLPTTNTTAISTFTSLPFNMIAQIVEENYMIAHIDNTTILLSNIDSTHTHPENVILCCSEWLPHKVKTDNKDKWYDLIYNRVYGRSKYVSWRSQTTIFKWLYQNSLINSLSRWLEKMNVYTDVYWHKTDTEMKKLRKCEYDFRKEKQPCVREWLNLSKISGLVGSVSDR